MMEIAGHVGKSTYAGPIHNFTSPLSNDKNTYLGSEVFKMNQLVQQQLEYEQNKLNQINKLNYAV